jgi:hypothetical protein
MTAAAQEKPDSAAADRTAVKPQSPVDLAAAVTSQTTLGSVVATEPPEDSGNALNSAISALEQNSGMHWGSFFRQWGLNIGFENAERLIMERKTRAQLNGRYFHDWFSVVANYQYGRWDDGDKFFTSNFGHPAQGAIVEAIFWQNNDHVRFSDQDFHSAAYRKALLQAFAFATIDAVQWKLGPVGEATIGHVGLYPTLNKWGLPTRDGNDTGLNDLVMNEVGGTAMMIGFQWLDKHFQKPMENRIRSRGLINSMRVLTNPPQSMANIFRFKKPWYRDNREPQQR